MRPLAPPIMPNGDRLVLSRGDVCLRESDVELLRGPHWLNDTLLTFYLQHVSASTTSSSVLLMDASVSYFLSACAPEDVGVVTGPLALSGRDLVLCPVSDSTMPERAHSGTHWTLLAFWPKQRRFVHYDSLARASSNNATRVAGALSQACGHAKEEARVEQAQAPHQRNGTDCGLHVLLAAQALADARGAMLSVEALALAVTPAAAAALRGQLLALVTRLAAEQEEQRASEKNARLDYT